jgi:hypothetical protein
MWEDKLVPSRKTGSRTWTNQSLSTSASACSVCLFVCFFFIKNAKNQSQEHKENYYYHITSAVAVSNNSDYGRLYQIIQSINIW